MKLINKINLKNACIFVWGIFLILHIFIDTSSFSIVSNFMVSLIAPFATLLTIALGYVILTEKLAKEQEIRELTASPIAIILSVLIILSIYVGTASIVRSFWSNPADSNSGDKFFYENLGVALGFASFIMTFILSTLQKNVFFVTRKRNLDLDERQLRDRQEVYELAYKFSLIVVIAFLYFVFRNISKLDYLKTLNDGAIPGHLIWLPINLGIFLIALPLIVATLKRRKM